MKRKKRAPRITTFGQAKRVIKVVIGFSILLVGFIMIVTPGPGLLTIITGLAILGTEFVWAKKLLKRFENEANNVKNSFVNNCLNKFKSGANDKKA